MTYHSEIAGAKAFAPDIAFDILNRAVSILAEMIPGCTARRLEGGSGGKSSQVMLCFGDAGPTVPIVTMNPSKYCTLSSVNVWQGLMLMKGGVRHGFMFPYAMGPFTGPRVPGMYRLDAGSESIAQMACKNLAHLDFAALIAAGAPEQLVKSPPRWPVWDYFMLGLCDVYLRRYDQAAEKLGCVSDRDCTGWAPNWNQMIADAKIYSDGLKTDPESVRTQTNCGHARQLDKFQSH